MKFIQSGKADGETVNLSYSDYGSGKTIVLVHGWPSSKEMWEYQIAPLVEAGFRVVAYDRRGFGHSDRPWSGYDYDTLADDLRAVLEQLDLDDITLVGFSMGGGEVARYFAKYGGARVSKAVLVSTVLPYMPKARDNENGITPEQATEQMESLMNDRIGFLDAFGKQFFGVGLLSHPLSAPLLANYLQLAAVASPRATQACMKSFGTTDFREDIAKITAPTLIIHGASDKIVPIEISSDKSSRMVPNNQYIVYEDAPHGLFYTHRDRLNNDLIEFIQTRSVTEKASANMMIPGDERIVTMNPIGNM
jgi:pimeloyl-ACP methyl ester carboxylesterase